MVSGVKFWYRPAVDRQPPFFWAEKGDRLVDVHVYEETYSKGNFYIAGVDIKKARIRQVNGQRRVDFVRFVDHLREIPNFNDWAVPIEKALSIFGNVSISIGADPLGVPKRCEFQKCGKEFQAKHPGARFCKPAHRLAACKQRKKEALNAT